MNSAGITCSGSTPRLQNVKQHIFQIDRKKIPKIWQHYLINTYCTYCPDLKIPHGPTWVRPWTHIKNLQIGHPMFYIAFLEEKNNLFPVVMSFISLFLCVESLPSFNKTHLSCGWVMNCTTLQNSEEIRTLKYMKHILIRQKHSYALLNIEHTEIFSKNIGYTILQNQLEIRILKYVKHILIFKSTVTPQKYSQKY